MIRFPWRRRRPGQAMTETVLLFPLFMFFLFAFAKIYALLILVQKIEIASFYAARRWQLESHRNAAYVSSDNQLMGDIQTKVSQYLGYGTKAGSFLDLLGQAAQVDINRTQVWQVVTLTVKTHPINMPFYKSSGFTFEVTKYVPNRDRPIAFILPGLGP
ncbi:MAG: hypothetical protein NTY77_09470 [Elusimicrobia bacterium]|nr:hypothetical protein [Elusimicrobiota bacterium]